MTDRELLELAAKAAGIEILRSRLDDPMWRDMLISNVKHSNGRAGWNPLADDGDALRLAVKLGLSLRTTREFEPDESRAISNKHELGASYLHGTDACQATRRAIVRAAAEIGKAA